ncbi:class I SAM-dependent methyltransferase [Desulfobaculum bizertense]|uniref:O-Methyltransferase involved in polyketide biosynthesis n=1 Tax=Desulfobaculum bizertense DSM 18034 TaxID=1121442 RepID=A0A1T4W4Q8_9BACT|nr:class I SAM-dependent methyltransferase [Desulfobaculum bizertense]SKA72015.1 O-Methyltransferase involved in polyketide biosynthesis [Desulfobaculum bizertense DSM 18034]
MSSSLQGIPETLLIPLWARAVESKKAQPIVVDSTAADMLTHINFDFSVFEKVWLSQLGVAVRTMLLDNAVRSFVRDNPDCVVVNFGAGLDTRFHRIGNEAIRHWYDLDVQSSIDLRRQLIPETERNTYITCSVFDPAWEEQVQHKDAPLLFIAEGLLMYFSEHEVRSLFMQLTEKFPHSDILFEMLAPFMVGRAKHHDSVNKLSTQSEFTWGMAHSKDIEKWSKKLQYVEEWNYYDYYKARWKWWGILARFPLWKAQLSNRIVHVKVL